MVTGNNENFIKALGIENLPDDKKAAILEKASELVQKRLLVRIMETLGQDKRQGFIALLDSGDALNLNSFIQNNCPQFPEWMMEEIAKVRQELSGLAAGA